MNSFNMGITLDYNEGEKMIKKYRKQPVEIEAIEWTGNNFEEVKLFMGLQELRRFMDPIGSMICKLEIPTLEGVHEASEGDYIIKGVKGEFYPCKPDIFHMTYQEVPQ